MARARPRSTPRLRRRLPSPSSRSAARSGSRPTPPARRPPRGARAFGCLESRRHIETPPLERKFAVSPVRAKLGVAPGETVEAVRQRIVGEGLYRGDWRAICAWLKSSLKERDREIADFLENGFRHDGNHVLEHYVRCFLSSEGKPRSDKGWFISADLRKQEDPHVKPCSPSASVSWNRCGSSAASKPASARRRSRSSPTR